MHSKVELLIFSTNFLENISSTLKFIFCFCNCILDDDNDDVDPDESQTLQESSQTAADKTVGEKQKRKLCSLVFIKKISEIMFRILVKRTLTQDTYLKC